jgi:DNA-binding SARP family transcriptional activator
MITLRTFGDPALRAADGARLDGLTRQPKKFALLIYLACSEGPCSRDDLMATFWPEADTARCLNSLRQALFVIRRELGTEVITGHRFQPVLVDGRLLSSDVDAFRRALAAGAPEAALELYAADFLSGFHVHEAPLFDFWAEELRAKLRDQAGQAAEALARKAEAEQRLSDALRWWRRRLELLPYDEPTLRRIVSLLVCSGNRATAIAAFDRFRRRVMHEVGVDVSPFTLDLAVKVADGSPALPPSVGA